MRGGFSCTPRTPPSFVGHVVPDVPERRHLQGVPKPHGGRPIPLPAAFLPHNRRFIRSPGIRVLFVTADVGIRATGTAAFTPQRKRRANDRAPEGPPCGLGTPCEWRRSGTSGTTCPTNEGGVRGVRGKPPRMAAFVQDVVCDTADVGVRATVRRESSAFYGTSL